MRSNFAWELAVQLLACIWKAAHPALVPIWFIVLQLLAASTDTPEVHLAWIKTARKRGGLGFMQVRSLCVQRALGITRLDYLGC